MKQEKKGRVGRVGGEGGGGIGWKRSRPELKESRA